MTDTTPPVGVEDSSILAVTRIRGRGRRLLAIVCATALVLGIVRELTIQTRGARGPASSSYATSPGGLAALASLLAEQGVEVSKLTRPLDEAWYDNEISPIDTVVIFDQDLSEGERDFVRSRIFEGGTIIGGGRASGPWISDVTSNPWINVGTSNDGERDRPIAIVEGDAGRIIDRTAGVRRSLAVTGNPNVWTDIPSGAESTGVDSNDNPVVFRLAGLTALADPSMVNNANLATADNAAFALDIFRPQPDGRVIFAEAGHGFRSGNGAGLAALPRGVRTALFGLLLGALTWMLAVGRRIGDADLTDRPLPPGRYEHVAAIASLLERAKGTAADRKSVV